jgi:hypothetical protein
MQLLFLLSFSALVSFFQGDFLVPEFPNEARTQQNGDASLCLNVNVAIKVFLEGPYNSTTHLMNTTLRSNNLIPSTEPYSALRVDSSLTAFTHVGLGGGENQSSINADIVDWVFIELYTIVSPATTYSLVETKSALLQSDGKVIDPADQTKKYITFTSRASADYIIGVRHRNHLFIKMDNPITLFCDSFSQESVDFTTTTNAVSTSKMNIATDGVKLMRAGDVNANNNITAFDILKVRDANVSGQTNGYKLRDVNMSGQVSAFDILATRANNKAN